MLSAQSKFDERYYFWALEDWEREISENYALVRSVRDSVASRTVRIMESLNSDEQRRSMAIALAKRARDPEVLIRCSHRLTERDKKLAQLFMDMFERESWREASKIPLGGFPQRLDQEKLNRKKFKQCIIGALSPILGENYEDWGDWEEWRYCNRAGPWQVITSIDVGGQYHQLCYGHDIIASEHVYLAQNINLLRWLGIGSQTQWQFLLASDAEPTAEALARIVAHFMEAVPRLLEGLTPD